MPKSYNYEIIIGSDFDTSLIKKVVNYMSFVVLDTVLVILQKSLKSKVSPHFLFKSLDVLNVLISDNPEKATFYVDRLSMLYRYLVRHQETEVVFLNQELEFVENYIFLLKVRFGEQIKFDIDIDLTKFEDSLIPLASLHIIINRLFNISNRNQRIDIFIQDDYLFVKYIFDGEKELLDLEFLELRQSIKELVEKDILVSERGKMIKVGIPLLIQINV